MYRTNDWRLLPAGGQRAAVGMQLQVDRLQYRVDCRGPQRLHLLPELLELGLNPPVLVRLDALLRGGRRCRSGPRLLLLMV